MCGSDSGVQDFYNRVDEIGIMQKHFSREPSAITVLVGPRSSGKTALLHHLESITDDTQFAIVNCRRSSCEDPTALAIALAKAIAAIVAELPIGIWASIQSTEEQRIWPVLLATVFGLTVSDSERLLQPSGDAVTTAAHSAGKLILVIQQSRTRTNTPTVSEMRRIYDAYTELLQLLKANSGDSMVLRQQPVLIIDELEADVLTTWSLKHSAHLKSLLQFFADITSTSRVGHVVLATSEYSLQLQNWLQKGQCVLLLLLHTFLDISFI
jgi:AAA+ ATPase superfamily predicted ATPase